MIFKICCWLPTWIQDVNKEYLTSYDLVAKWISLFADLKKIMKKRIINLYFFFYLAKFETLLTRLINKQGNKNKGFFCVDEKREV